MQCVCVCIGHAVQIHKQAHWIVCCINRNRLWIGQNSTDEQKRRRNGNGNYLGSPMIHFLISQHERRRKTENFWIRFRTRHTEFYYHSVHFLLFSIRSFYKIRTIHNAILTVNALWAIKWVYLMLFSLMLIAFNFRLFPLSLSIFLSHSRYLFSPLYPI